MDFEHSDNEAMTFGERLRSFREEAGLSIADVAAYLGKTERIIREYEGNVKLPPFADLWLLCFLFYCSLDALCAPLAACVFKNNEVAACLRKYILYFNKFYYSNREFVTPENKDAILALIDYEIYPREKNFYLSSD